MGSCDRNYSSIGMYGHSCCCYADYIKGTVMGKNSDK